MDASADMESVTIRPAEQSGSVVDFRVRKPSAALVMIHDVRRAPVPLARTVRVDGRDTQPVGRDGASFSGNCQRISKKRDGCLVATEPSLPSQGERKRRDDFKNLSSITIVCKCSLGICCRIVSVPAVVNQVRNSLQKYIRTKYTTECQMKRLGLQFSSLNL